MQFKTILNTYYSYKEIISTKLLDISEFPSSIQYRTLSKIKSFNSILTYLNGTRQKQRERAVDELNARKTPENTNIKLSSFIYVIPFEYENFHEVKLAFKLLSSTDNKTRVSINNIIKNKDNLGFSNWINFGVIGGQKKRFLLSKIKPLKNIPKNVDSVELLYTRIMPSFALMVLKFNLSKAITEEINDLQNKEYLEKVIFTKFFPINKFPKSKMLSWEHESQKVIEKYKDKIKLDIEQWSIDTFKFKNKVVNTAFFIDKYQIKGNPIIENNLKEWIKDNRSWLNDYGLAYSEYYENNGFNTIYSSNIVIELEPYIIDINGVLTGKSIHDGVLSRIIVNSINSIISKYTDRIEKLRAEGFMNLQKSSFKILKSKLSIEDLKITMMYLNRLEIELELNKENIRNTISQLGIPKNIFEDKKSIQPSTIHQRLTMDRNLHNKENENPADKMITDIFSNLKRIKKHLEILDMAVSDVLSIENTKAIYKLQKTVIWITVIGVIVAIMGVAVAILQ
ncbi:MAG: hypothetical protein U9N59_15890 [Campylobacterota bacterium]|nr:hypothetical protein [Campylobacterota bacterium]